jgi:branched-subunit amino acid aminotransferase/4-amino-4-deoxychorismate lyase
LAEKLVAEGLLSAVVHRDIERQEMPAAREVLVCGTSPDVVSVVEWEGLPVGAGTPGPVGCRLGDLLKADLQSSDLRTPVLK